MKSNIKKSYLLLFLITLNVFILGEDYVVKKGDTLSNIAEKVLNDKTKWKEIAQLNNLEKPFHIQLNQILKIPENAFLIQKRPDAVIPNNDEIEKEEMDEASIFTKKYFTWLFMSFLIYWAMSTIALRIGSWFSLVKTNLLSCALLSFVMTVMVIVSIATMTLLVYLKFKTQLPLKAFLTTGFLLTCMYFILSTLTAKRILDCYWRSLITILIMTTTVGSFSTILILWVINFTLPKVLPTETIQHIWAQIPF